MENVPEITDLIIESIDKYYNKDEKDLPLTLSELAVLLTMVKDRSKDKDDK